MNWFRFAVTVSISVLSVAATHVSADKSWQRSSVELVQAKLNDLGYPAGPVDGAWGRKTSSALTLYCEEYDHDCSDGEKTVIDLLTADTDNSHLDVEMDFSSAVWFENRIGYGAPKDRVDRYVGMTRREAVALVITELEDYQDPFELPSWFYEMKPLGAIMHLEDTRCDTGYLKNSLKEAWLSALYQSEVPQFDRLSVFWLDHFSVGYDAYEHPHAFGRHLQFVRDWKDKSFPELLYASLSDPSTIVYLNNDKSDRNTPNENLAREFFELFALGEGNYSEEDIREFARLLTGHAFNLAGEKYQFMNERAIKPNAKIFGKRYTKAETLVRSLNEHPDYGHFIIQKLYNEYVSLDDVSDRQMRLLKHRFLKDEQSILALVESIISSKDFWNTSGQLTLIKSPLDLFAGTSRTLNTTGPAPMGMKYWKSLSLRLADLNQDIFDPDSIDGWPVGKDWLQGGALDRRAKQLQRTFSINPTAIQNSVRDGQAVALWQKSKQQTEYKQKLEDFFLEAKKDQLLVEDILVKSDHFKVNRGFGLDVTLKNLLFNGKKYPQLSYRFLISLENDQLYRNHVQVWRENTSGDFLKDQFDGSDGAHVWYAIHLPLDAGDKIRNLSSHDRKLLTLMIRSAAIILEDNKLEKFNNQARKLGPKGEEWLTNKLKAHGPLLNVYDARSPVRVFNYQRFNCDREIKYEQYFLDSFFEFKRLMNVHGFREKSELAKMLTKVWETKPSIHDSDLSTYLLPEFAKLGDPVSLTDTFSLVEYNLR